MFQTTNQYIYIYQKTKQWKQIYKILGDTGKLLAWKILATESIWNWPWKTGWQKRCQKQALKTKQRTLMIEYSYRKWISIDDIYGWFVDIVIFYSCSHRLYGYLKPMLGSTSGIRICNCFSGCCQPILLSESCIIPIGSMVLVYMLTLGYIGGISWWDPCYLIYSSTAMDPSWDRGSSVQIFPGLSKWGSPKSPWDFKTKSWSNLMTWMTTAWWRTTHGS